ncbi:MAG: ABC transporter permease, partial [Chloroflexota bacterium]|nr:ABC transporter permease [Chloroflexota bacterium]
MRGLLEGLKELKRYPSAVAGLALITGLVGLALYAMIAIPYGEAIRLWRGGEGVWAENPRNALPAWVNLFSGTKLPETMALGTESGARKSVETLPGGLKAVEVSIPFDYNYDDFPSELAIFLEAKNEERKPNVSLFWLTPDGRRVPLGEQSPGASERYSLSLDSRLTQRLGGLAAEVGLFTDPAAARSGPQKGRYGLVVEGLLFEKDADLDARLVVYGKVHGLAGTDHRRRDLTVALLWGAPIALAFGLLAALGSTIITLVIAALGAWYGKTIDAVIQRVTEVNAILPTLPILILVGTFYSRSIWVMLGVLILLGIFSLGIKTYRAIFLQIKDAPYIEAAKAYGAGDLRIVFLYMVPRVLPILVPGFVTLIPSIVFLEAALAVLGLGDPVLPTWGKVLNEAFENGALYKGYYYWVLEPSVLLMLTGLGFAMLGFAL